MKRLALIMSPLLLLPGCGKGEPEAPDGDVRIGLERSVADVRAAEAAASGASNVAPGLADAAGNGRTKAESTTGA